jgi:hypothetical protein
MVIPALVHAFLGRVADFIRGSVRLMFPVASLGVLAALLYSAQGRDVLRALVSVATRSDTGHAIGGLVFLMAGSALLSASVWYASRWLLTAQMVALPLPPTGFWQTWLPRLMGFAAPLMVAAGLWGLNAGTLPLEADERFTSSAWAAGFVVLAAVMLAFYILRGALIVRLNIGTGGDAAEGAAAGTTARRLDAAGRSVPAQIGPAETTPPVTRLVIVWSIAVSAALGVLFFLFPITLPRMVGAAGVAALALASINLFGSFVLTYAPLRQALPPLWLWVVLAAGVLVAQFNDNHVVEPARGADASAPPPVDALQAIADTMPADRVIVFVASEGGGIRAAYWTAAVLDALDAQDPQLKYRMRVLSGVSGGSLGVAAWLASHRRDFCPDSAAAVTAPGTTVGLRSIAPPALAASTALSADFVAPAVAGMFYGDLVQRFIPAAIGPLDRSRAIEGAWQRAFAHLPGQPFEHTLDALYSGCPALPQLVLNATRVETGERVALTRLPTPATMFVNTFDAMQPGSGARTQSLAGLVHHSARFPLVSPAGTVEIRRSEAATADAPPSFRLVDGGYFDNSGVQSALDLMFALQQVERIKPFRPLLLVIRNSFEPLVSQPPHADGASRLFPESGSIALALLNVRGSHAVTARGTAKRLLGDDLIDLDVPKQYAEAPLGWALSDAARRKLDGGAKVLAAQAAPLIAQRIAAAAAAPSAPPGVAR